MKALILSIVACLNVRAATIFLDSPTGNLGTTHTFTDGSVSITTYGFSEAYTSTELYSKNNGGDENGLGLAHYTDFEIATGLDFIQVYIGNISDPVSFSMDSSTGGEQWVVIGSDTLGDPTGTILLLGSDEASHSISTSSSYLTFEATTGNVLINHIGTSSIVPEPATFLFAGAGLIFIGMVRYRPGKK